MRDLETIILALKKRRKYASFYEGPNKQIKELGIVDAFVEALAEQGIKLRDPRVNEPDPPDCVCIDAAGDLVALEVVELVCQEAVERNQKGESVYRWWEPDDIRNSIAELLSRKDKKRLNGGPYADIAALIHTDEPVLTADKTREALVGVEFGPFEQLTRAFLMFSYIPGKGHEVLKLAVRAHNSAFEGGLAPAALDSQRQR